MLPEAEYPYSREDLGRRLSAGYRWQWFVAYKLGLAGFDVRVSKHRLRDEGEDNGAFRNEVDIAISLDWQRWEPVEVKSKNETFTEPRRWPFDDVICYAANKADGSMPVLLVSTRTQVILGVHSTEGRSIRFAFDTRRGMPYRVYCTDRSYLVTFDDWCAEMKRRLAS